MQYVRSISGSVSKTWNSINPATLSGAIDVIVIEQEDGMSTSICKDLQLQIYCIGLASSKSRANPSSALPLGTLACSPFHVRFGKFSLLRPYEKKVEFKVNGIKQDYAMKLGEGGEAFFVFETTDEIPASLQTSPLVSPAASPKVPGEDLASSLQEPEYLDLEKSHGDALSEGAKTPPAVSLARPSRAATDIGAGHSKNQLK